MSTASSGRHRPTVPGLHLCRAPAGIEIDTEQGDAAEVALGPDVGLSVDGVEAIAHEPRRVGFSAAALAAMRHSAETLAAAYARGDAIYGLTTGFGPHVRFSADADPCKQGAGLIAHLGAGWGRFASREVVRATLAVRSQAIAQGRSGIDPGAAAAFLALLNHGICPAIPEVGSVGASGDLIPLAHAARVLAGEGRVIDASGGVAEGADALAAAGLAPVALTGRDALALVNGTSFMTAYAALAAARSARLLRVAESLTGWAYRALACRDQAIDPRLHEARGHRGQVNSAENIAAEAFSDGPFEDATRPLQEVYSLRCAPQFLGACRDQIDAATRTIEREINGVNDNPVVCGSPAHPAVLHGGNFQGQQIAFAADMLNAATTQIGVLMERQLDVVLAPDLNGGAPLLLAWQPGATSGMAGAQITATAITADMRRSAAPSAIASMPTNGRNQDVVSMGTMAARVAFEQTERLAAVLAIHGIALGQLDFLREHGRAPGRRVRRPEWFPAVTGFREDRPLYDDIASVSAALLSR